MKILANLVAEGVTITPTELSRLDNAASELQAQISTKAVENLSINNQTGTTYTLVLTDGDSTFVRCNNADAITLTVPPNASVAFGVGAVVPIRQVGAGAITLTPGSGVTLNAPAGGTLVTAGARAQVQIVKVATDEWDVIGQTVAA